MAKTPNTMLNKNGKSEHPHLGPDLRENLSTFHFMDYFLPKSIGTFLLLEIDIKNNGKPGNSLKELSLNKEHVKRGQC